MILTKLKTLVLGNLPCVKQINRIKLLPREIQQIIYEFAGHDKEGMMKTLQIINNGIYARPYLEYSSDTTTIHIECFVPNFGHLEWQIVREQPREKYVNQLCYNEKDYWNLYAWNFTKGERMNHIRQNIFLPANQSTLVLREGTVKCSKTIRELNLIHIYYLKYIRGNNYAEEIYNIHVRHLFLKEIYGKEALKWEAKILSAF